MEKKSIQEYIDVVNWLKWEAHNKGWLYIELNAEELLADKEPGVHNIRTVGKAMLETMLEGDEFTVLPKTKTKISKALTIKYYVDNLSSTRNKYVD